MAIEARLLGPPLVTRDGVVYAAPRGKKVWALFAYLALSQQPPTRQQLADLLFPDAEDPANALRWNLSELRRLLGGPDTVGSGATVGLRLPIDTTIDVRVLQAGTSADAVALPGLGRELLEGVRVEASAGFAAWLLGERRRLQSIGGAVLREGALRALAAGNERSAVELATPIGRRGPARRGRPRVARARLRRDRRRVRGAAAADRVGGAVPRRARGGHRAGALRRGTDRVGAAPRAGRHARGGRGAPGVGGGRARCGRVRRRARGAARRGRRRGRRPGARGDDAALAGVGAGARGARPRRGRFRGAAPRDRGGRRDGGPAHLGGGASRARLRRAAPRGLRARAGVAAARRGAGG